MLGHECLGASGGSMGQQRPVAGLGALSAAVPAWVPLNPKGQTVSSSRGLKAFPASENVRRAPGENWYNPLFSKEAEGEESCLTKR